MKKNILIIVYKFPPMGGIGTRRWVKFSKYLTRLGYQVHILTVDYKSIDTTTWSHDTEKSLKIHRFKSRYPLWLLSQSKSDLLKEFKRYSNFILRKLFFYIDIAQYDAKSILGEAKKIISQYEIRNVIASGHPVSINYFGSYLKIDNADINLIQDYRDNWNDLGVYQYGSRGGLCLFNRKEISAYREYLTLFYADKVINVSEDLTKKLYNKHKSLGDKFLTLTNGYDSDDVQDIEKSDNGFKLIYAGSLFNGRIEAIYLILDALSDLDDEYINNNFKIVIYSNYSFSRIDSKYQEIIDRHLIFRDFIPPQKVLEEMAKFPFCLSINSKQASYAFGTKIFDYMALDKGIVHISNGGALYDVLKNQGQFVSDYTLENVKKVLLEMKNRHINPESKSKNNYSDFSLSQLTLQLEKLFV